MERTKHIIKITWLALALGGFIFYLVKPSVFTPEHIKGFLSEYEGYVILIYSLVSLLKGFVMLPNSPFVLAGVLIFPEQPWLVFWISLMGIMVGGSFIHLFADRLDVMKKSFKKSGGRGERMKIKVNKYGFWIVALWAFFPLTPTNLICYIAGATKMPYKKFVLGLFIGQVPLILIYVFFGTEIMDWMLG